MCSSKASNTRGVQIATRYHVQLLYGGLQVYLGSFAFPAPSSHSAVAPRLAHVLYEMRPLQKTENFCNRLTPLKISMFFSPPAAVFLALHSHEQPCASDLSAGLLTAGLLWPGNSLWSAGSFLWHAHALLYGSRGENSSAQTYHR